MCAVRVGETVVIDHKARNKLIGSLAYSVGTGKMSMRKARKALRKSQVGKGTYMKHAIEHPEFFTGGNAIFTVTNPSGEHYTYRIRKPRRDMPFFVQLLSGPDNTNDYTYIGIYAANVPRLVLTAKSKLPADSKPVLVFTWAARQVARGRELPQGYSIQHEGRCCRCGRRLTVRESIESGIGPECAKRGER